MPISDDHLAAAGPPTPPPSFIRRHPILAGFGVLSGLSLFSALWPVSAIIVSVAIAADVTGLDRKAWSLTRSAAERIATAVRAHLHPDPSPSPAPVVLVPSAPHPSAPPRDLDTPPVAAPRLQRAARERPPVSHEHDRARHPRKTDHPVETRIDGRGM